MGLIYKILKVLLGRRKPKKKLPAPQRPTPHQDPETGDYNDNLVSHNSSEPNQDEINQEVYHEVEPERKHDPEPESGPEPEIKEDSQKITKPKIMTQPTYNPDVFPADEPVIILLTGFLSIRLQQMVAQDHSVVRIPVVPDWTDCGYTLSNNFSVFVKEVNEKLKETALLDNLLSYTDETSNELSSDTHPGILLHKDEILMAEKKLQSERRIAKNTLTNDEKWVLIITLVPHIYPHFYNEVIDRHIKKAGDYPQMGFIKSGEFRGYCPTGETIFFMLAGHDFDRRIELQRLFQADQVFSKKQMVWLEDLGKGEPIMSGKLVLAQDYLDKIMFGEAVPPDFSMNFPAKQIETQLSWNDLVINNELQDQIGMILSWVFYNEELMVKMGLKKRIKKGFRSLFYGPPGTGKTLTAGLLGNITGKPVYRIDLSMVVSKYIGETEKNLEQLFARAEDKGWILFFDEADAIFGKRTNIRDAHDKYANQEVSYLLQRIEDYNGLIIMATNMKSNIDESFIRRFNSMLKFSFPDEDNRAKIWERALPKGVAWRNKAPLPPYTAINEKELNIPDEVKRYELSGGNIVNVVQYAALKGVEVYNQQLNYMKTKTSVPEPVLSEADDCEEPEEQISAEPVLSIYLSDVLDGIRRELIKEGKPFAL